MTRTPCALLALAAGMVACSPGDCPPPPATVLGAWTYSATQTAPSMATLGGILTLQPGCPGFQGILDGTQNDGVGLATPVHVVVTGQMLGTTSVDFDASGRRHLGTITNDSMRGTWFEQASGGNGSFLAVKDLTP